MSKRVEVALRNLILKSKKRGISEEAIRDNLLKKGYMPFVVNRAIHEASLKRNILRDVLIGLVMIVLIGLLVLLIMLIPRTIVCEDNNCFVSAASGCDDVRLEKEIAGSLFEFAANDCVLTKTLVKVGENEDLSVKTLFEGESMNCPYEKGAFDADLIDYIIYKTDDCNGFLKESLDEIVSLQES